MATCDQCGEVHHFVLQVREVRVSLCPSCLRTAGKTRWEIALQRLAEGTSANPSPSTANA
jgi:hypothetical protein